MASFYRGIEENIRCTCVRVRVGCRTGVRGMIVAAVLEDARSITCALRSPRGSASASSTCFDRT
jgi:hypothetical protein